MRRSRRQPMMGPALATMAHDAMTHDTTAPDTTARARRRTLSSAGRCRRGTTRPVPTCPDHGVQDAGLARVRNRVGPYPPHRPHGVQRLVDIHRPLSVRVVAAVVLEDEADRAEDHEEQPDQEHPPADRHAHGRECRGYAHEQRPPAVRAEEAELAGALLDLPLD